jgi:hypothetical protein
MQWSHANYIHYRRSGYRKEDIATLLVSDSGWDYVPPPFFLRQQAMAYKPR